MTTHRQKSRQTSVTYSPIL